MTLELAKTGMVGEACMRIECACYSYFFNTPFDFTLN
jgi:hypothetical protein